MWPLLASAALGYMIGRDRPNVSEAVGYAGLAVAEDLSGAPLSLLGFASEPSIEALVRGGALGAAYAQLGFWGAVGAHLAYGLGATVRGDVR